MVVEALKAAYGDALVVKASNQDSPFTIVIDGGPEETEDKIADYYLSLGYIDLLILTHYDEDHIKGLIKFFSQLKKGKKRIGIIWANCAHVINYDEEDQASAYDDAFTLASYLSKLQRLGVIGEWCDHIHAGMVFSYEDKFKIDVLSPDLQILESMESKCRQYIDEHGLMDDPDTDEEVSYKSVLSNQLKTLDELADSYKTSSTTFMNTTSIAIFLTAEGQSVLLLGDAEPRVLAASLSNLGISKDKPLNINLMKVSHHGSKSNISPELMELIDCRRFLFTTNGGTGGAYHPDRQTIACLHKWMNNTDERKITLYFNYPLDTIMIRNTGLLSDSEKSLFNIVDDYTQNSIPTINI